MELNELLWSAAHPPDHLDEAPAVAPAGPLAEVRRLQMVVEALVALAVETGLEHEEVAEWLRQTLPAEAATLAQRAALAPASTPAARARAAAAPVPVAVAAAPRAASAAVVSAAREPAPAPAPASPLDYDDIFRTPSVPLAAEGPLTTCASCGAMVAAGQTNVTASGEVCDNCYARMA